MASTDARPIPQKNVAYRITFPIFDADGDLVTGATGLDSEVSKDGGTFTDCTNEATEIATSSGMYYLDLTSTEMNADTVAVIVKTTSSGAKTTPIVLYPEEAGDVRVNVTQVNGTTQTAGDLAALINTVDDFLDTDIAAIKAKTDNLPASPANEATLTTIAGYIDTEVAAIKAKTDNLPASPASTSDVLTQVNAALDAASTELTAVPTTTGSLRQFIQFLHAYFRNKKTQTSTTETLYKEDASTSLGTSTLSDNGTTASKGEMN